ncbi:MAG: BatA domain-containing protein [Gemmataceae bacterium]|nr:BatA domain-containing protein [Gemmataceae bacterium]
MLPLLTAPWALAALAAIPALAALYWLRNTWREVPVSSLMLWLHHTEAQASGLRMRRLETPLLFFLEIAALILLASAAVGPRVDTGQGRWPLVVVLDDSFSMLAGGDESPRRLAEAALQRELHWGDAYPVRFILAGDTAVALGDTVWSWTQAQQALEGWRGHAAAARLPEAAALASELAGDKARILVVSDHGPEHEPGEGRLEWWSFGKPRPNLAFINAARSTRDGVDRCLLEIANFEPQRRRATLVLHSAPARQEIHREQLTFDADEIRRVTLRLPKELTAVSARLDDDALPFDNEATLVREEAPAVRVAVHVKNDALRLPLEKALEATGRTAPPGAQPQLLITDDLDDVPTTAETWLVQLLAEKDADPFIGPFVLDRTHPLTDGLNLAGVVWGAGKSRELAGAPVILAGGVPLISDAEGLVNQRHVRVRLRPDQSTLLESPAWPVLMWNLVHWRATELPGVRRANIRLGEAVHVAVALGVESVVHASPAGGTRVFPVAAQRVMVRPDEPGLHEIDAETARHQFAVNVLRREESDLTKSVTGRWGTWSDDVATAPAIYNLAWIPLLVALAVLTLHMALAVRAGK